MKKRKLYRSILLAGTAFMVAAAMYSQSVDSLGRPMWMSTPKPQATESANSEKDVEVYKARAKMFDSPGALRDTSPDLTQANSSGRGSGRFEDFSMPESLPVASSDAVVAGVVQNTQPFLSSDHTRIYSELYFIPDNILKDSSKRLVNGQCAVILSGAGSIKFPDGRVATLIAGGGSSPINVDKHYLLFLHYEANAEAYTVMKAWDLSGDQPQELDLNGHPSHRITSDSNDTTTQESFMALIKSRIESK